jgi:hypothetical protein
LAPPQAELQAPQCDALVWVLTQVPPHWVTHPVLQMPLLPHTPRSFAAALEQTAQVGPQAKT